MPLSIDNINFSNITLVGDRVLVKPKSEQDRTKTGLFLPPGVQEKEYIQAGYVVKVGPGYPIPAITDPDEPWKDNKEQVKYVPLQPLEGDMVIYLQSSAWEVEINGEKFFIVPHNAILLIVSNQDLYL
jgi:co-chaperonin GroES (HSP10)